MRAITLLVVLSLAPCLQAQVSVPAQVRISGDVAAPVTLTAADLSRMPRVTLAATSHGQTGTYEGVSMRDILTRAGVPAGEAVRGPHVATTVIVKGADGYQAAFALAEFDPAFTNRVSLLADRRDGTPLDAHAAPFQLILSDEKRPARWVRQVVAIEVRSSMSGPETADSSH